MLNKADKFLSDLVVYTKYANYLETEKRRQSWYEAIDELMNMHIRKFPHLKDEIRKNFLLVYDKKVLPSMRSVQFGGLPIEFAPNRIFNCSYALIDDKYVFTEIMFLLLGGSGVGYSVRKRHVSKLPMIKAPIGTKRFLVGDSIEGWADTIRHLMVAYFEGKPLPTFDYRDVRKKGAKIKKTGGKAPGPEKLIATHQNIVRVLNQAVGRHLTTVESHDIACYIADCIVAGGVRDAAMISLFDKDDTEMLNCKSMFKARYISHVDNGTERIVTLTTEAKHYNPTPELEIVMTKKYGDWDFDHLVNSGEIAWYYIHPQRGRSNNSVALNRATTTREEFEEIMLACERSKAGEPGIYWCNNDEDGTNPCAEIALPPNMFCNLTTAVVYDCATQAELNERVRAAAFIGTLQASYTDFHMLRPIWKENTEREALLGVSLTGMASGDVFKLDLTEAAEHAVSQNVITSKAININPAHRVTCIKPEGSGTLAAGVKGNGAHDIHSEQSIRNVRIKKSEPLYPVLLEIMPDFVEDEFQNENARAVISIPLKAKPGSLTRDKSTAIDFLERVKMLHEKWIMPGHIHGENTHNVSATVSIKDHEWAGVINWMWDNKMEYNGISCLPYDGGNYKQAPFIEITEAEYDELFAKFPENFDFTTIVEEDNNVDLINELACSGAGACVI